jgi:hypothetical protein
MIEALADGALATRSTSGFTAPRWRAVIRGEGGQLRAGLSHERYPKCCGTPRQSVDGTVHRLQVTEVTADRSTDHSRSRDVGTILAQSHPVIRPLDGSGTDPRSGTGKHSSNQLELNERTGEGAPGSSGNTGNTGNTGKIRKHREYREQIPGAGTNGLRDSIITEVRQRDARKLALRAPLTRFRNSCTK